jgi:hypothetical protein
MKSFLAAMHKFQGMVHAVERDRANPHFKSRYATLEKVCDTIRPAMQSCGLVWMQMPGETNEHGLAIRTIIAHAESGEMLDQTMVVPLAKRDPQGVGSALTYGMRYSLMAALGLPPTDDDDGNEASKPAPKAAPANAHARLSKAEARSLYERLDMEAAAFENAPDLKAWWNSAAIKADRERLPEDWLDDLFGQVKGRIAELISKTSQKEAA